MSEFRKYRVVIFCLLLTAATLAFYYPIVHNHFIDFDDQNYILKNPHVQAGLTQATLKWSLTTFYLGIWHPLTWLSHALDCQVFGLNPVGHHYTSLMLHVANALMLFLLLQRATGFTTASLLTAVLFALHPINVESVAWAAERKNVLSTLFFLLALHAYDRYGRGGRRYLYWMVAVFFALGLMAKPQIVTLPFVLLLWDYWPLQRMAARPVADGPPVASTPRSFRFLVWEKLPLFILAAADSVITVIAQRAANSLRPLSEVSMMARLQNVFVAYVRYIGKAFWPFPLVPMYPRPAGPLPAWQVVGAVLFLVLISAIVFYWRDRRYLVVGWLWFLGTLVPMIGIITVGDQAMADRYAYVPLIGLFIAVIWTLAEAANGELASYRAIRGVGLAASALVVLSLGTLTDRQIGYWHDSETLWRYTLSVTQNNYTAHNNLALALYEQGRTAEALVEFRAGNALRQYPPAQLLALALYELRAGHPQEAIEDCNAAMPASTEPTMKATVWSETGQAQLQLRQYDQAVQSFQNALRLNPDNGLALMGSGVLALRQRQADVAVIQLLHAAKVDPSDLNVVLLVQALRHAGRTAEADWFWAQVQKVSPNPGQAQSAAAQILSFVELKPI